MATFALLPGAGTDSWYWHPVSDRLEAAGHRVVPVDLPAADPACGLADDAAAALDAIDGRTELVVVAHSLGAFTAPLLATEAAVELFVLVAPMIPSAGESAGEWWANTGQAEAMEAFTRAEGRTVGDEADEMATFFHDVGPELAEEAGRHELPQADAPFEEPWPLSAWPEVPTRVVLCRRDRIFPPDLQRRLAAERLGVVPDEVDAGHVPMLSRPAELADLLLGYAAEAGLHPGPATVRH